MKKHIISAVLAVSLAFGGSLAAARPSHHASAFSDSGLLEHGHYRNVSGHTVHSPAHTVSGRAPAGASARCGDGSYSFSEHHRGTCSHHGGVTSWL